METIQISKTNAIKAHRKADKAGRELLENLLDPKIFNEKITDRVKSFEDACEVLGYDAQKILPFPQSENNDQEAANAFIKLTTIARALNEGWVPEWTNHGQTKYYPWFEHPASGVGFSYSYYGTSYAGTGLGSRLCYKTSELAMYVGKQFTDIYNTFFLL
jgi:hypothetical protein